jgi:hypothetical protein
VALRGLCDRDLPPAGIGRTREDVRIASQLCEASTRRRSDTCERKTWSQPIPKTPPRFKVLSGLAAYGVAQPSASNSAFDMYCDCGKYSPMTVASVLGTVTVCGACSQLGSAAMKRM